MYVDDMLVKSKEESPRQSPRDVHHSKKILDEVKPQQVHLGVASGKFLGFMVSWRGIEANPENV